MRTRSADETNFLNIISDEGFESHECQHVHWCLSGSPKLLLGLAVLQ